ncbi:hypothetical protein HI914_02333 [Erysiphe necator]|nr:hypothetical protein HI914_02333 [Erysiphe necator]
MIIIYILMFMAYKGVFANTEKVIFEASKSNGVLHGVDYHDFWNLPLEKLSPQFGKLKTKIFAEFPTLNSTYGRESWFLLHGISQRHRYEARICWTATQPTSFQLVTYDFVEVLQSLDLKFSLEKYSMSRKLGSSGLNTIGNKYFQDLKVSELNASSSLLLQIFAAADYYTTNASLMQYPQPVQVEIILDPYFLNIVPKSLIPTIAYILILVVGGWSFSIFLNHWAQSLICNINIEKKTNL